MGNLAIGVALIPSKLTIAELCRINASINAQSPSAFVLKRKDRLLPHLSLFQGIFPIYELKRIKAIASAMAECSGDLEEAVPSGISVWAGRILFLDMPKPANLMRLHLMLVAKLMQLTLKGAGPADPQSFKSISSKERASLRKYSYPFAGNAFRPHFTLGRANRSPQTAKRLARNLQKRYMFKEPIIFESLAVFEVGKFGRFERQIASYKIRKKVGS